MKNVIYPLVLAFLLSGCANLMNRTSSYYSIKTVYQSTCECADAVAEPFREPKTGEESIGHAVATLLFPVLVVDLPFEVVLDTICLPWDGYRAWQWKKNTNTHSQDHSEKTEEILN